MLPQPFKYKTVGLRGPTVRVILMPATDQSGYRKTSPSLPGFHHQRQNVCGLLAICMADFPLSRRIVHLSICKQAAPVK